jgi:hypothetical protein
MAQLNKIIKWICIGVAVSLIVVSLFIPPYLHVDKSVWEAAGILLAIGSMFIAWDNIEKGKDAKFSIGNWTIEFKRKPSNNSLKKTKE